MAAEATAVQPLEASELVELAELGSADTSLADFEQGVFRLVQRHVGFDLGFFRRNRDYGALSAGTDLALMQEIRPLWPTFITEGHALCAACSAQRGVAVDAEVYGARLERLTAYQRLTKPSGMRTGAMLVSQAGGRFIAALLLGRRSSEFRPAELERLRQFAAFIRLAETWRWVERRAARASAALVVPESVGLTERERELLSYLGLGYTNEQIASACGVSPYTVRNQLSRAYSKLGVATRAEAVAALRGSGLAD
ncbi:MAG TPA: helix-turn-helix transcriptional regulator [Polyangiaceae bacterium]|nr:helix-turn-helix transcriptional regulator [Polyangiaceae bacterium]